MAIRNDNYSGSDWSDGEVLYALDLNDTFDEAINRARASPAFWLNSNFWTNYDDFESYSLGTFSTGSLWTITTGGSGTSTIVASTNAGGTGSELYLTAVSPASDNTQFTSYINSNIIPVNRHVSMRLKWESQWRMPGDTTTTLKIKIGSGGTYQNVCSGTSQDSHGSVVFYPYIFVVALGSNLYDVYSGGKKIISSYDGTADNQIYLSINSSGSSVASAAVTGLYIDDVRYSSEGI